MTVYEHRTSMAAAAGSVTTATLYIPGGLGRQLLIRANTDSTLFRAQLVDENNVTRRHWGFHRGELNDTTDNIRLAFCGSYSVQITNASVNDTFLLLLAVQE